MVVGGSRVKQVTSKTSSQPNGGQRHNHLGVDSFGGRVGSGGVEEDSMMVSDSYGGSLGNKVVHESSERNNSTAKSQKRQ